MSINSGPEPKSLAEQICDGDTINWPQQESVSISRAQSAMQLLETIARTCRDPTNPATEHANATRWGTLQLRDQLGEGAYGSVHRAFDPLLKREVALKLSHAHGNQARQWLGEARRLSRVNHQNVVAIHGAEINDGRAGIWFELIDGQDMQQWVAQQGPLGSGELVAVGQSLCAAMAAVHAVGLIHGDIKPTNILREKGGRIVLLDFGSARDSGASELLTGSPAYLAPELLEGGAPSTASDIYALGKTLRFLLAGKVPAADSTEQSLLDLRPDLPVALAHCIDAACETDVSKRPASVGAFARGLVATPSTLEPVVRRRSISARVAMIGVLGMILAVALWSADAWMQGRAPLLEDVALITRDAGGLALPVTKPLRIGQPLALRITTTRPVFVYIINQDDQGHSHVLYPLSSETQAIPAGKDIELPGVVAGQPMDWQVDSASTQERFAVVVAIERQVELERLIADWSRAGQAIASSDQTFRGVGELVHRNQGKPQDLDDLVKQFNQKSGVEVHWLELSAD